MSEYQATDETPEMDEEREDATPPAETESDESRSVVLDDDWND